MPATTPLLVCKMSGRMSWDAWRKVVVIRVVSRLWRWLRMQQWIWSEWRFSFQSICVGHCFSTRVPRVAARGFAETDWMCLGRNSQPQFYAVCNKTGTWIIAQGSMSNENICGRFRCSKR